jgi:heme/copper-type cytochrome/quinol oxidase subunit 2
MKPVYQRRFVGAVALFIVLLLAQWMILPWVGALAANERGYLTWVYGGAKTGAILAFFTSIYFYFKSRGNKEEKESGKTSIGLNILWYLAFALIVFVGSAFAIAFFLFSDYLF